jgi:hypothetical protein
MKSVVFMRRCRARQLGTVLPPSVRFRQRDEVTATGQCVADWRFVVGNLQDFDVLKRSTGVRGRACERESIW